VLNVYGNSSSVLDEAIPNLNILQEKSISRCIGFLMLNPFLEDVRDLVQEKMSAGGIATPVNGQLSA